MAIFSLSDLRPFSGPISSSGFKPWWETIRSYLVYSLFAIDLIIFYSADKFSSASCTSSLGPDQRIQPSQTNFINSLCYDQISYQFRLAGPCALAGSVILYILYSWWEFVPAVPSTFSTVKEVNELFGKHYVTRAQFLNHSTTPRSSHAATENSNSQVQSGVSEDGNEGSGSSNPVDQNRQGTRRATGSRNGESGSSSHVDQSRQGTQPPTENRNAESESSPNENQEGEAGNVVRDVVGRLFRRKIGPRKFSLFGLYLARSVIALCGAAGGVVLVRFGYLVPSEEQATFTCRLDSEIITAANITELMCASGLPSLLYPFFMAILVVLILTGLITVVGIFIIAHHFRNLILSKKATDKGLILTKDYAFVRVFSKHSTSLRILTKEALMLVNDTQLDKMDKSLNQAVLSDDRELLRVYCRLYKDGEKSFAKKILDIYYDRPQERQGATLTKPDVTKLVKDSHFLFLNCFSRGDFKSFMELHLILFSDTNVTHDFENCCSCIRFSKSQFANDAFYKAFEQCARDGNAHENSNAEGNDAALEISKRKKTLLKHIQNLTLLTTKQGQKLRNDEKLAENQEVTALDFKGFADALSHLGWRPPQQQGDSRNQWCLPCCRSNSPSSTGIHEEREISRSGPADVPASENHSGDGNREDVSNSRTSSQPGGSNLIQVTVHADSDQSGANPGTSSGLNDTAASNGRSSGEDSTDGRSPPRGQIDPFKMVSESRNPTDPLLLSGSPKQIRQARRIRNHFPCFNRKKKKVDVARLTRLERPPFETII